MRAVAASISIAKVFPCCSMRTHSWCVFAVCVCVCVCDDETCLHKLAAYASSSNLKLSNDCTPIALCPLEFFVEALGCAFLVGKAGG